MEAIVLAISGVSLLGVSAVLRRTAEKHISTVHKNDQIPHERVSKKPEFESALEGRALIHSHVPALLSREVSSVLEQ